MFKYPSFKHLQSDFQVSYTILSFIYINFINLLQPRIYFRRTALYVTPVKVKYVYLILIMSLLQYAPIFGLKFELASHILQLFTLTLKTQKLKTRPVFACGTLIIIFVLQIKQPVMVSSNWITAEMSHLMQPETVCSHSGFS